MITVPTKSIADIMQAKTLVNFDLFIVDRAFAKVLIINPLREMINVITLRAMLTLGLLTSSAIESNSIVNPIRT